MASTSDGWKIDGGTVYGTTNAGSSWSVQYVPAGMSSSPVGIDALSPSIAWAESSSVLLPSVSTSREAVPAADLLT